MADPFKGKGMVIAGMVHLSGKEALEAVGQGALLVDLRPSLENDYKKFDVPEVLHIPFEEIGDRIAEMPHDRPVIVADSVGLRSKAAVGKLMELGYDNVANLNGGILDWEHDGLPIIIALDKQLSGSCSCRLRPRK